MSRRGLRAFAALLIACFPMLPGSAARATSGATSAFISVSPARVLDTRTGVGAPAAPLAKNGVVTLSVAGRGGLPSGGLTAVVLNVTVTATSGGGYVTVFPGGAAIPNASNLNMDHAGQTVANLVTVPVSDAGTVGFFSSVGTHIIADVFGYYTPAATVGAGRFVASGPARVYDSRPIGKIKPGGHVTVGLAGKVPTDATAAVVNITVVDADAGGYWTSWANGQPQPNTLNINTEYPGHIIANAAIVPVGPGGLDFFASAGGHLLVDVTGYFTGVSAPVSTSGLFVPVAPNRFLDTRGSGEVNPLGPGVKPQPGWTAEVPVPGRIGIPSTVSAVVANITLVSATKGGWVTTYAARTQMPDSSTANALAGQTVPNHAIIPVSPHGFSLFTSGGAHLIADISGWFTGAPSSESIAKVQNKGPAMPVHLLVPSIGIDETVREGIDDATINSGPGHWPGTSLPGLPGTFTVFGHRISHSHPFANLDLLKDGDELSVTDANGVLYRYVVEAKTYPLPEAVGTGSSTDSAIELIACHPPGSIQYRIVVRARLVSAA